MRVIAGSARRIPLKTLKGLETRPTTDRIKETLFNMIQYGLADCMFLDLFAGSGAIGIEALSRGAAGCVFVEQNRAAVECIRENLQATKLLDRAVVMHCDGLTALGRLEGKYRFDYIFMDPPYGCCLEKQMFSFLADSGLVGQECTLIAEARLDEPFSYLKDMGYTLAKEKLYKTNKHIFVHREAKGQDGG